MKTISTQIKTAIVLLSSLVLVTALNSCVSLVASYDAKMVQTIVQTGKTVDKFYLTLSETTPNESNARSYDKYANMYSETEAELNSLLLQNKARQLNKNSTRICEIALEMWVKVKTEHKKANNISDAMIIYNRKAFGDMFLYMLSAEESKKFLNNQ